VGTRARSQRCRANASQAESGLQCSTAPARCQMPDLVSTGGENMFLATPKHAGLRDRLQHLSWHTADNDSLDAYRIAEGISATPRMATELSARRVGVVGDRRPVVTPRKKMRGYQRRALLRGALAWLSISPKLFVTRRPTCITRGKPTCRQEWHENQSGPLVFLSRLRQGENRRKPTLNRRLRQKYTYIASARPKTPTRHLPGSTATLTTVPTTVRHRIEKWNLDCHEAGESARSNISSMAVRVAWKESACARICRRPSSTPGATSSPVDFTA